MICHNSDVASRVTRQNKTNQLRPVMPAKMWVEGEHGSLLPRPFCHYKGSDSTMLLPHWLVSEPSKAHNQLVRGGGAP